MSILKSPRPKSLFLVGRAPRDANGNTTPTTPKQLGEFHQFGYQPINQCNGAEFDTQDRNFGLREPHSHAERRQCSVIRGSGLPTLFEAVERTQQISGYDGQYTVRACKVRRYRQDDHFDRSAELTLRSLCLKIAKNVHLVSWLQL